MTAQPDTFMHRSLRLTGKGRAVLAAAERVTPDSLFTDAQLAALTKAGYSVVFVRAERLLGMAS